jgi:hypothetical protein
MRMVKPVRVLWTLALAAVVLLPMARVAFANVNDVSTERSGSIIVFPKVVWDGTRDTIIQIANTGNNLLHARCFYVNAAPLNPLFPPGPTNPAQCNETDFDVWLTRQQPTHWVASEGRTGFVSGFGSGNSGGDLMNESGGFSPGLIPPVTLGFIGELKCVQVDASDAPLRTNALKGEATIRSDDGDVSEYNAVAFQGNPDFGSTSNDLVLDLTANHTDGEYSACPDTLLFNHFAEGASDMVINQLGDCSGVCTAGPTPGVSCTDNGDCGTGGICGGPCPAPISTELTLVPCSQNLENQVFGKVTVQFLIFNEFEQPFSTSTTVSCFLNLPLGQIGAPGNNSFTFTVLGTLGAYSRINPNPGNGGVIGVAEEIRRATSGSDDTAAAIFNLHTEGNRFDAASNGKGQLLNCPTPGQAPCATDQIIVPEP